MSGAVSVSSGSGVTVDELDSTSSVDEVVVDVASGSAASCGASEVVAADNNSVSVDEPVSVLVSTSVSTGERSPVIQIAPTTRSRHIARASPTGPRRRSPCAEA